MIRSLSFTNLQYATGEASWYQLRVFLVTQLSYACIAGSLVCTMYDSILPPRSVTNCTRDEKDDYLLNSTAVEPYKIDFVSLIMELGLVCAHSYVPTLFSTMVMAGGVTGAAICGFLADRFGRRPLVLSTLAGCFLFNTAIAGTGHVNWILTLSLLFGLGFSGGGYMVVNLVLLLEVMGGQHWRLGATAFNGFPLGLMTMALLGYLTGHWRWYHASLAAVALACLIPGLIFLHESPRWLVQQDRMFEAEKIMNEIARINRRPMPPGWFKHELEIDVLIEQKKVQHHRQYSYMDLFRYRQVFVPLLALFFSWLASAVISYGIYFNLDKLAGNRFLNTFLMGLFKGTTGMIPFLVGRWIGRKPVLIAAVTMASVSCWAAVLVYFLSTDSWSTYFLTAFSVMGASAIDPIWKVNHLYSTELFPTVVRNMARAVCNVGARVGSVLGPQVAYIRIYHPALPYLVFGILSLLHLLDCVFVLPETKNKPLPDKLPDEECEQEVIHLA